MWTNVLKTCSLCTANILFPFILVLVIQLAQFIFFILFFLYLSCAISLILFFLGSWYLKENCYSKMKTFKEVEHILQRGSRLAVLQNSFKLSNLIFYLVLFTWKQVSFRLNRLVFFFLRIFAIFASSKVATWCCSC